jgi:hypothetical protein
MLPPDEKRMSLAQAATRFPGCKGADRIHPASLTRWITRGVRSVTGEVVRLEAERVGCRWMVSVEAIARFTAALAGSDGNEPEIRSPAARQKAADAAERELIARGG